MGNNGLTRAIKKPDGITARLRFAAVRTALLRQRGAFLLYRGELRGIFVELPATGRSRLLSCLGDRLVGYRFQKLRRVQGVLPYFLYLLCCVSHTATSFGLRFTPYLGLVAHTIHHDKAKSKSVKQQEALYL